MRKKKERKREAELEREGDRRRTRAAPCMRRAVGGSEFLSQSAGVAVCSPPCLTMVRTDRPVSVLALDSSLG